MLKLFCKSYLIVLSFDNDYTESQDNSQRDLDSTELFILEVQKHRSLWDRTCRDYKNTKRNDGVWQQVVATFQDMTGTSGFTSY
jgi:hypothetical protein